MYRGAVIEDPDGRGRRTGTSAEEWPSNPEADLQWYKNPHVEASSLSRPRRDHLSEPPYRPWDMGRAGRIDRGPKA